MGFYEEISKYYDYIFPTGNEQIKFIINSTNKENKKILDIACGSGGYAVELAKQGFILSAVDLDQTMINLTKGKAKGLNITLKTYLADMLNIDIIEDSKFNVIYCIGNSLAHLNDLIEVNTFLKKTYGLLADEGYLIVQIINFDRVLEKGISELPTITNNEIGLTFERKYIHKENKILFNTILKVNDKLLDNNIPLLPIKSDEILKLLSNNNYQDIETFGDFKQTKYDPLESYHLVIKAKKK
ncbi:MAG: methyltransferase type 11 [Haloplasmataceae bacterium]|nr:methyltransferase type 11 [Haloplasmataceae bacterium]